MASHTMVEAEIWTLAQTEQGNVVLVRPKGSELAVPIFIGQLETQAILIGLGHVEMPRPLTHDLAISLIRSLSGVISRIEIHDLREGTYFARVVLKRDDEPIIVDARPSDAIGIAVRVGCPVFISEDIVDEAGISVNLVNEAAERGEKLASSHSLDALEGIDGLLSGQATGTPVPQIPERERLEHELEQAVAEEDYERAALLRDKIRDLGG